MVLVLSLGGILRLYKLDTLMTFFADQGWFYVSARDALISGQLPTLGITSSVTWLHQGPLFTYLLIPALMLWQFHPVGGSALMVIISLATITMTYFLGRLWYDKWTGLIAALFLAVSPLAIIHSRLSYHTSPIPFFFVAFLLMLYTRKYFFAALFLGFLYQLELASIVLWPIALLILLRQKYDLRVSHVLAFLAGILPFIIAGPIQAGGVFIWALYRLFTGAPSGPSTIPFYSELFSRLILPSVPAVALSILVASILYSLHKFKIQFLWFLFPAFAMVVNGTPSEAYITMLIVPTAIAVGLFLSRIPKPLLFPILLTISSLNFLFLISTNYLLLPQGYGPPLSSRVSVADSILSQSSTPTPHLVMLGPGSHFHSYDDPYVYLFWWLGRLGRTPGGPYSSFQLDELNQTYLVLE